MPIDRGIAKSLLSMDEAIDPIRTDMPSKRRKLNIDNAFQGDIGNASNTPNSQLVEEWAGCTTRSPSVIDLTGCDDVLSTSSVPETPAISDDERATNP